MLRHNIYIKQENNQFLRMESKNRNKVLARAWSECFVIASRYVLS